MILDTNGFSAIAEGDPLLNEIIARADNIYLPVIVLGEYIFGILQSRYRLQYKQWLEESLPIFRILAIDENTAEHYADIRLELKKVGRPIPANDMWIAALTRQHGSTILSRDTHFDSVPGLKRVTW